MLILPETPRYLIKKGNHAGAAKSLSRLRRLPVDHPTLREELAEIEANHEYEMSIGTSSYASCFKAPIRKRLFTGMALQALQQLTGVNFIESLSAQFYRTSTY
jgi:MFS transporter, SP family, sugar:H+ symporter